MWKCLSTFLLYCFTATLLYIATVAIIIDVSTLGTPEVEWGVSPCRSRPPFWCLILWWNRGGDLGERAPGDFTFGCPICKWAELQCGSTPGYQAEWHALLLLLLLVLLQHYHKGCGSPRPLSGVYIEHWCNDNVVFCSCFFWIKKKKKKETKMIYGQYQSDLSEQLYCLACWQYRHQCIHVLTEIN